VLNRKRRLIEIKDVQVLEEGLRQLNRSKNKLCFFTYNYASLMRKAYGGYCCVCSCKPDKIATFHIGNSTLIEYYCLDCLHHWNDDLKDIDEKLEIKYR